MVQIRGNSVISKKEQELIFLLFLNAVKE